MKKIIFSGFMGALLSVPAFAAGETSLTTKGYVDDGLRAVYNASKDYTDSKVGNSTTGLTKDVNDLKTTINGDGTAQNPGLAADVTALDEQINGDGTQQNPGLDARVTALENNPSATYTEGTGIDITNGAISVDGLSDTTGANAAKMYIYQNGALTEMPVVSSWSTDGLTF